MYLSSEQVVHKYFTLTLYLSLDFAFKWVVKKGSIPNSIFYKLPWLVFSEILVNLLAKRYSGTSDIPAMTSTARPLFHVVSWSSRGVKEKTFLIT